MPEKWHPTATRRPGANAGYASGRCLMSCAVCHFTVGRDSRPIGDRGYFTFLVSRDGEITQFAEADAATWHAGNWNIRGPGIEVEYLPGSDDEIFTEEAYAATANLVAWLESEWGIPSAFYDGERVTEFNGFITHRSLIQTADWHYDYWPSLPVLAGPPVHHEEDELKPALVNDEGAIVPGTPAVWVYDRNNNTATWVPGPDALTAIQKDWAIAGGDPVVYPNGALIKAAYKFNMPV